jgi:hypothetical protein
MFILLEETSTQKQIMFMCVVSILSYGWMCEELTAVNR